MISTSSGGASRRMGGRAVDGSRRRFALRVRAASSARAGHAAPRRTAPRDQAMRPWRIHVAVHRALTFNALPSTAPRSCRATEFELMAPSLAESSRFDNERARESRAGRLGQSSVAESVSQHVVLAPLTSRGLPTSLPAWTVIRRWGGAPSWRRSRAASSLRRPGHLAMVHSTRIGAQVRSPRPLGRVRDPDCT